MGLAVNNTLAYPNYFAMIPTGPDPNAALTEGFFALAATQKPRLSTVALVSAAAEFSRNPILRAKDNAKKYGFANVYEVTYPLTIENFTPVIDAVYQKQLRSPVSVLLPRRFDRPGASDPWSCIPSEDGGRRDDRPSEHSGENHSRPAAQRLRELRILAAGPEYDVPRRSAIPEGLSGTRQRSWRRFFGSLYGAPRYAQMQVVAQAVEATGGSDDAHLSSYARDTTFDTVMGKVKFGVNGEWAEPRVLQVQFQGISGTEVDQFQNDSRQIVVSPPKFSSGDYRFPYAEALSAGKRD
jgi:branched-chain amino acid transport system substrate-binding protein